MNIYLFSLYILTGFLIMLDGFRKPERQFLSKILVRMIELYQRYISVGILKKNNISICRFHPTCSEYTRLSLLKYGLFKGSMKGFWRILRCNPWFPGGIDEP